jgi:hypothetical protein
MEHIIQPRFLILFAVAGFFFFGGLAARDNDKAAVAAPRLTRWAIVAISVAIVTLAALKVLRDHT